MGRRSPRRNAARAVAAKKTRAVRPRYRLAPPPCNEQDPLCVRHTTRRTVWGVQLVRQGWSWVRVKGAACAAQSVADRRMRSVACVCVRSQGWGGRAFEDKRCASQLTPQAGVLPAD